ncbi:hypothetical protein PVK06_016977 [Gossypium arboreum]|uniref:Retrotransposon gag domain-containing protein n=1 Tax=Gossypium arboreum TaxID=29729 RepID=A0ABR0Q2D4_GOSAR|nr:hypothetical protein PVK06_016977 [Gossypium arboreum]
MNTNFELKSGLIQLLPTFRGLQNENPHKYLKEFHTVCLNMKPQGVTEDQIKLSFPASHAAELRREIIGIRQKEVESFYNYWERFKKLCASCLQHGVTEQSLLQYFYEGLKPIEMNMVDASSRGALLNMTPQQARDLISTMAVNTQQFRANPEPTRRVHQLSNSTLEDKVDRLTNTVNSLVEITNK